MKVTVCVLTVILIGGCIPLWINTFYSPSAESGIVKQPYCGGTAGPKSVIEFVRHEVKIQVKVNDYKIENGYMVFIRFEIPKDKNLQLASSIVQIADLSDNQAYEGPLDPIIFHNQTPWQITDILKGDTTEIKGLFGAFSHGKFFGISTQINMPKADKLKVHVPSIIINNKEIKLPNITFQQKKSAELLAPINC